MPSVMIIFWLLIGCSDLFCNAQMLNNNCFAVIGQWTKQWKWYILFLSVFVSLVSHDGQSSFLGTPLESGVPETKIWIHFVLLTANNTGCITSAGWEINDLKIIVSVKIHRQYAHRENKWKLNHEYRTFVTNCRHIQKWKIFRKT